MQVLYFHSLTCLAGIEMGLRRARPNNMLPPMLSLSKIRSKRRARNQVTCDSPDVEADYLQGRTKQVLRRLALGALGGCAAWVVWVAVAGGVCGCGRPLLTVFAGRLPSHIRGLAASLPVLWHLGDRRRHGIRVTCIPLIHRHGAGFGDEFDCAPALDPALAI